jgi:hypothetical protein
MNVLRELVQGRYIKEITISICAGTGAGKALMFLNLPNKGGGHARDNRNLSLSKFK